MYDFVLTHSFGNANMGDFFETTKPFAIFFAFTNIFVLYLLL